ncbi:MAG TPA: lipid A biosynthesis acyltransferase [Myxococcota bacterium]|nr:lipid A biosynthesis acyltransferase [Myxococcota bacterium]
MSSRGGWATTAERGSMLALRSMQFCYRILGRRLSIALLVPIASYFFLTSGRSRRASRDYLETLWATPEGRTALGQRPRWWHVLRHHFEFSINLLDRMVIWQGDSNPLHIEHEGSEHMFRLAREKRGAILLGAHLGSFDLLRLISAQSGITVNVLMFTAHAEVINRFFEKLNPQSRVHVIPFDPNSVGSIFEIKGCLDRGELVGILGDRLWQRQKGRTVVVNFLGRPVLLPLGPFLLQTLLGCPMLLALCVRTGRDRYRAVAHPFVEAGPVPRAERVKRAQELAQAYAKLLEEYCVQTPYQWFNFFDFFEAEERSRP